MSTESYVDYFYAERYLRFTGTTVEAVEPGEQLLGELQCQYQRFEIRGDGDGYAQRFSVTKDGIAVLQDELVVEGDAVQWATRLLSELGNRFMDDPPEYLILTYRFRGVNPESGDPAEAKVYWNSHNSFLIEPNFSAHDFDDDPDRSSRFSDHDFWWSYAAFHPDNPVELWPVEVRPPISLVPRVDNWNEPKSEEAASGLDSAETIPGHAAVIRLNLVGGCDDTISEWGDIKIASHEQPASRHARDDGCGLLAVTAFFNELLAVHDPSVTAEEAASVRASKIKYERDTARAQKRAEKRAFLTKIPMRLAILFAGATLFIPYYRSAGVDLGYKEPRVFLLYLVAVALLIFWQVVLMVQSFVTGDAKKNLKVIRQAWNRRQGFRRRR